MALLTLKEATVREKSRTGSHGLRASALCSISCRSLLRKEGFARITGMARKTEKPWKALVLIDYDWMETTGTGLYLTAGLVTSGVVPTDFMERMRARGAKPVCPVPLTGFNMEDGWFMELELAWSSLTVFIPKQHVIAVIQGTKKDLEGFKPNLT